MPEEAAPMRAATIIYPVLVQVLLTFVLLLATARARMGALSRKEVKVSQIALGQDAWPPGPTKLAASFHNQFEMPVLFYALVALALGTGSVTDRMIFMAWVFVALRVLHAIIHAGANVIRYRFLAFAAGVAVLLAMWIDFGTAIAMRR